MKINYVNWSLNIFMGFYESVLFNSDTEYWISENERQEGLINNNQYYEIDDFKGFMDDVASYAVDKLWEQLTTYDLYIIKSMKYKGLQSPKYYNYDTDRLIIYIDVNLTKLKKFINHYSKDFNEYLKQYFTSYDGFISYIPNNLKDFKTEYKTTSDKTKYINAMLEFYLLSSIHHNTSDFTNYETPYHYDLMEYAYNQVYNYRVLKTEADA